MYVIVANPVPGCAPAPTFSAHVGSVSIGNLAMSSVVTGAPPCSAIGRRDAGLFGKTAPVARDVEYGFSPLWATASNGVCGGRVRPPLNQSGNLAVLRLARKQSPPSCATVDLRDGALWIVQNKTKAKRTLEITGELAALIERIGARPRERLSAWLIQDDNGKPLGTHGLRSRFDKARRAAGVEFQFRDIRAKAATDTGDLAHSQKLLGHRNREMTEHYVRQRIGERVAPLR